VNDANAFGEDCHLLFVTRTAKANVEQQQQQQEQRMRIRQP
jgi:hypothetical protein